MLVEEEIFVQPIEDFKNTTGIDMGFSQIVTLSDSIQVPNPKYLRNLENRLKKIQRKFSKTKKSSKRSRKVTTESRYSSY